MKKIVTMLSLIISLFITTSSAEALETHVRSYSPVLCRHVLSGQSDFNNPFNYSVGNTNWGQVWIQSNNQIVICPIESEFEFSFYGYPNHEWEQNVSNINISMNYTSSIDSTVHVSICHIKSPVPECGLWQTLPQGTSGVITFYIGQYGSLTQASNINLVMYKTNSAGYATISGYSTAKYW